MRVVIPLALVIVAGALWWVLQPAPRDTAVPDVAPTTAKNTAPTDAAEADQPERDDPAPARPRQPNSTLPPAVTNALSNTMRDRIRADLVRKSAQGVLDKVAVQAPATKAAGPMDREAVRFAVEQAKPGIVDCYAQALEEAPELAGKLTMKFTVHVKDGVGTLRDAEVADDGLGNPFLGMCALGALAKVEFEGEQDGVVTVNYPFNLSPGEKK